MPDWTNWTNKQDTEVLDRVYRMRADGTISTTKTISIIDLINQNTFDLMAQSAIAMRLPREGHERPKT